MRFLMMVIPTAYHGADENFIPPVELVEKMARFNESLDKAGVLIALAGLQPPAKGTRVHFGGEKPRLVDGPFAESKELVGGYWIIQAKSKEEALEWAQRAPMLDGDIIEVRQIAELSEFPEEHQKAAGR